jgi:GntR family transcriptional regulator, transcriptional repressor for pyruvate dehydrogenase complex
MGSRRTRGSGRKKRDTWFSRPLNVPTLRRGTLADRLSSAIRHRILLGDVKRGQRLESMRELSAEAGVSLSVVREAVAQLRAEGLVTVRQGVGTFVARRPRAARSVRAARLRLSPADARDLRSALEPILAERAAKRATERQIVELRHRLWERRLGRRSGSPDKFIATDLDFHTALAQAGRNTLGVATHRLADLFSRRWMRVIAGDLAADPDLEQLHSELVDAIDARAPSRARRAARRIAEIEGGRRSGP